MNWYNPTEGTWVVSGEFATSSILAGSGIWIEDAKGSGNLLITYTASGAKVFSSGVLQFSTLMAPAGVVTLADKGTLGSVKYHPRAFTDAEAIAMATGNITVSFTLRNLLNNSPQGVWYDPSDTTTLFQDSAGTTPVTASGQPVGLMLDKSKGLVLGPELVTNGTFDSGLAGWTQNTPGYWVVSGSRAYHAFSNNYNELKWSFTAATSSYQVTLDMEVVSGTAQCFYQTNPITTTTTISKGVGVHSISFIVTGGLTNVGFSRQVGGEFYIDNISVRELPGNHATQPTAGSRPIYRRGDSRGVVNLLKWSEAFDNAAWTKTVSITPFGQLGSAPAFKLARTNTTSSQIAQQASLSLVSGQAYTARVLARKGAIGELLGLRIQGAYPRRADAVFNLTTGVVALSTVSGGWSNPTATITEVSTGVYECTLSAVPDVTQGGFVLTSPTTFVNNSWEAATPSLVEVVITKAQLNLGPTALPYQRNDSHLGGVATGASTDLHWLETDGVDDGMATGNIDFTGTDKVAVFAGVRKRSDAARGVLVELSTSTSTNNGSLGLEVPDNPGTTVVMRSRGTLAVFAQAVIATAPVSLIMSSVNNIAGDVCSLRSNGSIVATTAADQGTGNFGNYPLYLFRRGGTSLPFNGWFYGLAITGRLATDAETAATERFLAAKSAVVIP